MPKVRSNLLESSAGAQRRVESREGAVQRRPKALVPDLVEQRRQPVEVEHVDGAVAQALQVRRERQQVLTAHPVDGGVAQGRPPVAADYVHLHMRVSGAASRALAVQSRTAAQNA